MPASDDAPPPKPERSELSQAPSWIMVGFVAGVLAVFSWQNRPGRPAEAPAPASTTTPAAAGSDAAFPESSDRGPASGAAISAGSRERLDTIDAVFADWGRFAIWRNDLTEVALWNSTTGGFTDLYEVLRFRDRFFYRPIDELTRPLVGADPLANAPLRFTEPAEDRRARLARDIKFPPQWLLMESPLAPGDAGGDSSEQPREP